MSTRSAYVLKMLQDIAEKEVDLATEALAQAMKIADEAQAKFDMLVNYRQDYSKSLKQSLETGIDAQSYQNFQGFFRKLDQAVKGQADMVEHAKQHVLAQQRVWKESQRKKLSYEVLLQRHDHKTNKVAQKKDQQMMDEFAMRSSRRGQ